AAFPAEQKPAQHRNVVVGTDGCAAFWARRCRHHNRLSLRDADDANVQEATNQQPEDEYKYSDDRCGKHAPNVPHPRHALNQRQRPRARVLTVGKFAVVLETMLAAVFNCGPLTLGTESQGVSFYWSEAAPELLSSSSPRKGSLNLCAISGQNSRSTSKPASSDTAMITVFALGPNPRRLSG